MTSVSISKDYKPLINCLNIILQCSNLDLNLFIPSGYEFYMNYK
jgi:hypothetical protein